jgi:hypothetical protein
VSQFNLRLGTENGKRRLLLLAKLARLEGSFTISALVSKTEVSDMRWLWDKDMLTIVAAGPLRYEVTDIGRATLEKKLEEAA